MKDETYKEDSCFFIPLIYPSYFCGAVAPGDRAHGLYFLVY
jgi:hypothetical protein